MRCLVGFFGLTRSLPHTAASIRQAFLDPLRQAGIKVVTAGHFNLPAAIDNPRSGEAGIMPDRAEAGLLDLDLVFVERQADAAIMPQLATARQLADPYRDEFRSVANLCHQLRSLDRLWSLLRQFGPTPDDVVLLLRADLLYLDRLDPRRDLAMLTQRSGDIIVPSWQGWGGLNDRFAFCSVHAARIYATRFRLLVDACAEMRGLHAEQFLRLIVSLHGLRVGLTPMRAVRVRASGGIAHNDRPMLAGAAAA